MDKVVIDGHMSQDVKQLIDHLHLPESELLDMFSFSFDNIVLTPEEAIRFIHFLRSELDKRTQ
ncbi:hypothetical protein [Paenibacillus roseipurpureus]|uniref:Uncharacterized protein n=1 Tax=Paenibacillus roseopurpureus TaxID=2918901 RepID=A0AA96LLF9_9BACL|nr:hypothetical protein [Paenibacillus sp. MBLB1832]WNR43276.1 hypothetical protein MJB10_19480 [Paenibacillus sp. MBLB1832]